MDLDTIRNDLVEHVITRVIPAKYLDNKLIIKYFSACLMLLFWVGVIIWARVVTLYSRLASILVLRVNLLLDQEVLAGSQPGLLVLLPFTRTGMTPARMLQAVIRRLEELQVSPEYSSKIVTMLAYYLEGKHSEAELAEFNDVLRRWEEMSIQLRYIGKEWREEGRAEGCAEGRAEGIRRSLAAYLNIRFNFDEETMAQKLAGLHDLKVLEELAKAVYASEDPVKAGLVIEQYTAGQNSN